jgi:hypothetical protein
MYHIKELIHSMEHSPLEVNSHTASQEIPRLLCNMFTRARHSSLS